LTSVFCSNCGHESRETERFCADCGNRLASRPVAQTSKQVDSESNSFENLIAARVREARKKSAPAITNSSGSRSLQESQRQPNSSAAQKLSNSKKSPFLFSRVTLVIGLLAMIVGYLVLPFAFVVDYQSTDYGSNIRKVIGWRIPTIASMLGDRTDEGYVFGPALSFLVGGYLWTLLLTVLIVIVVIIATRQIDNERVDSSDNREDKLDFLILLGRVNSVLMALLFTWQLTGMLTLQRAADTSGGLTGDDKYDYFSLGFGSVLSLLGVVAFAFAGASMTNRAIVERNR
jgi:hypothetical protein